MKKNYLLLLLFLSFYNFSNAQDTLKSYRQIPILGWYGIPAEETTVARYSEMKEAGFTHNFSFLGNASNVQKALDTANVVGIKIFISCGELSSDPENTVRQFMNHPALAGYFLRDEPSMSDFAGLAAWAKRIQAVDSIHPCYLNLLPNYASSSQLGTSNYRTHVNTFMSTVPLQFFSYDHYPFTSDSVGPFRSGYYDNLEIFSDEAKKAGKPFWAFAMATAIDGAYPIPTTAALRLQMFSDLAYGAQGLQYFTYWTPPCGGECFHDGPIYNGVKMDVYYKVKEVSQEIQNLSGIFLGSEVVSVAHTGSSIPTGTKLLTQLPKQFSVLETIGDGAVVSVLQRDSLAFLAIVNRDFRDSMKLIIKGDPAVKKVLKDGTLAPAIIAKLSTIAIGPGDIAVFTWPKGDSIVFKPISGLKVQLPLDYNLEDASGNNLHATDAGSVPAVFVNDSIRGRVAFFDKTAHAVLPNSDELKFATGDFTYSFWMKCPSFSGTPVVIGNKNSANETNPGFGLALANGVTWAANFSDGGGGKLTWVAAENGAPSIADNSWHFVAVSCERNSKMDIFLDGKLLPGSVDMAACPGNAASGYPAAILQGAAGGFDTYLDNIRIWDRAISPYEINEIYASDTTGNSTETAYLPLDQDLKDASGNGLDAADAGTVATVFVNDTERGMVASFDRLSHAVFPKVDALRFGKKDFAFSVWVKCAPASYTPLIVCNKNWSALGATRKKGFALYTNESNKTSGQRWSVNFGDGETEDGGSSNGFRWDAKSNGVPTIADNNWHFVALSFDRDKTMDVYLDGKLMPGSASMEATPGMAHDDAGDYPLTLMQDGVGKFFMDIPALLDEFRVWSRSLKQAEVASLYSYSLKTAASEGNTLPQSGISIYPNPASSEVNIAFNSGAYGETLIMIYNNTGVLVKNFPVASQPGANKTSFRVDNWEPGIYLVRVVSGTNVQTARLLVTN